MLGRAWGHGHRLRLTNAQRHRLAVRGRILGRKALGGLPLGKRCVSLRSAAGVALLSTVLAACAAPSRTTPAMDPVAEAAPPAADQPNAESPHLVTLRHDPLGTTLLSPDARWLVRSVAVEPDGGGWLVDDLTRTDAPPALLGLGQEPSAATFIAAARLLTFDASANVATLFALDTGEAARADCRLLPVAAPGARELATMDTSGNFVLLDPVSLAVEWRVPVPSVPAEETDLDVRYHPSGLVIVTHGAGMFLVDPVTREVLAQGECVLEAVSRSGKYGACRETEYVGEGVLTSKLLVTDFASKATIHASELQGWGTPVAAFSRDEHTAVVSLIPAELFVIDLPSGATRRIETNLPRDDENTTYITDQIALTEDGRYVCGHATNTAGTDTTCESAVFADLRRGRSGRGLGMCLVEGDTAYFLPPVVGLERDGRTLLPSVNSPNAKLCNRALSPDHRVLGLVTARAVVSQHVQQYLDAEMNLIDVGTGKVIRRLPLDSSLGQSLDADFSPGGRWLQVQVDERTTTLDTTLSQEVTPPLPEWVGLYDPAEARGSLLLRDSESTIVVAPDQGARRRFRHAAGAFCLIQDKLTPPGDCPATAPARPQQ